MLCSSCCLRTSILRWLKFLSRLLTALNLLPSIATMPSANSFGRGEYRYFDYPLPPLIGALRESLYAYLAPVANRWYDAMGMTARFPDRHTDFIDRCHAAGQEKPTPLLLQYGRATTTSCIRTCMESTFFHCSLCCCFLSLAATSKVGSS